MRLLNFFSLTICILFAVDLFAKDDPKSILLDMRHRLNEIHNGSYKATFKVKPSTSQKYYSFSAGCVFERMPVKGDSSYIKYRFNSDEGWSTIYNGENRFILEQDSSATIIDSKKYPEWGTYMEGNARQRLLYSYFFNTKKHSDVIDSSYQYSFLKDTILENNSCYVIHCFKAKDEDVRNYNNDIVIRKSDLIPLKVTTNLDYEDMHEYSDIQISDVILNDPKISIRYSIDSIPSFYNLSSYEEREELKLPANGTQMPSWELKTLSGKTMESSKLQSKLMLIDFWYKGCGPCIKAIPGLQKLHEEFGGKGLLVLGMNTQDSNDDLKGFLSYRKVTYPVLMDANPIAEKFNVDCFPTFFLVDNKGAIVYSSRGYSEELEKNLRNKIEEELKK